MDQNGQDDALLRGILGALARAVDVDVLREELLRCVQPVAPPVTEAVTPAVTQMGGPTDAAPPMKNDVLQRLVLADILDDGILAARPGDRSFPLRLVFGALGGALDDDDDAFALSSGLNFYFRAAMDDELKMRLGLEVSRLYYRFAALHLDEPGVLAQASPLLATLMNAELSRVRFESVDHLGVFDSAVHEREPGSNPHSAAIVRPATFLCRVAKSPTVRARAMVCT